jgi:hypothetical protein
VPTPNNRDRSFSAREWHQFEVWLNYIDKGLAVAYERSERGDQGTGALGVSDAVTGARWYATDLALLDALLYRASGLRGPDEVCQDEELIQLREEFFDDDPKLRDLRNALFSHPPFVDELITDGEVLGFVTSGVFIAPAAGGGAKSIVDVFITHTEVPELIARLRSIIERRIANAEEAERNRTSG